MAASISCASHKIKKINFNGSRHIVTQEGDQPALLALANALILRSSLHLPSSLTTITNTDLVGHIYDSLLSATPTDDASSAEDHQFKLNWALEFLFDNPWEMTVDPNPIGVAQFSPSPGLDVFSLLGVRMFHTSLLGTKELTDELTKDMEDGELSVLSYFERNKNFATIYKRKGVIYQLVSDEKYLKREDIVWEAIVERACKFVDQNWVEVKDSANQREVLVVKVCPQGNDLRLKVNSIQSEHFLCEICGNDYSGLDICYQCDHVGCCKYQICGGCYFLPQQENENLSMVEQPQILFKKSCSQGHYLKWDQINHEPRNFICGCCDMEFKDQVIFFQCSFPTECQYTMCGNCFYEEHDRTCGVRKQVQCSPFLKIGGSLSVIVTEVVSPDKFWFQLKGFKTSHALDKLMKSMDDCYRWDDEHEKEYRLKNPQTECKRGAIMAAPYESEGYHRVRINKISRGDFVVEVFYLDYGTISEVSMSEIRSLPTRFRSLPSQAIEGKLWGLTPPGAEDSWSSKSVGRFMELVRGYGDPCDSTVKNVLTASGSSILHLELYAPGTKSKNETTSINEILVCEGLAEIKLGDVEDEKKKLSCGQGNNNEKVEDCQSDNFKMPWLAI